MIDENDTGLAGAPSVFHNPVEDIACIQMHLAAVYFVGLTRPGIYERIRTAFFNGLHEIIGNRYRDIEIGELSCVAFAGDELQNVRVVHSKDAHIGATTGSPLLDSFGGGVEYAHKGNRSRCHPVSRGDNGIARPQAGERKTGAAAGLVDKRGVLIGLKNLLHGITDRQDKAGRQLSQGPPGIHESR